MAKWEILFRELKESQKGLKIVLKPHWRYDFQEDMIDNKDSARQHSRASTFQAQEIAGRKALEMNKLYMLSEDQENQGAYKVVREMVELYIPLFLKHTVSNLN